MMIAPCSRNFTDASQTAGGDAQMLDGHVSMLLKDLDTAIALGAPREIIARALDRLALSLVARGRRACQGALLLRQVMRLRADWRRGGHRLGRQSLDQMSARWQARLGDGA